jgi:mono/diheme cytochrome c family protein
LARELKGVAAGLAAGLGVVGASYAVSAIAVHQQAVPTGSQAKPAAHKPDGQPASAQLVASGTALYSSLACIGCHGAQAQGGGIGPTLHHLGDPDAEVARNIANGFAGKMPAYKTQLSTAQINTLVAYIQSLE